MVRGSSNLPGRIARRAASGAQSLPRAICFGRKRHTGFKTAASMPLRMQRIGALVLVAAALLAVAGCGSSKKKSSTTTSTTAVTTPAKNAAIAAEVPAAIRSKGTLTVAADATYPPNEFIASNGKTVVGMDPDLAQALGGVLGLKMKVVNVTFDAIIPGISAKKYDLGMSSFTDTKEREK